jgi:hypothetical protein
MGVTWDGDVLSQSGVRGDRVGFEMTVGESPNMVLN